MKRHYQLAVVGEDNKHVAVRINAIFEFCAVHDALMALEELVHVLRSGGRDLIISGATRDVYRVLQMNPHHYNAQAMLDVLQGRESLPDAPIMRIGHSIKPIPKPALW